MRVPSLMLLAGAAVLASACSRAQPADDSIQRDLDLALNSRRPPAIASAIEVGKLPAPKPPVAATAPHGSHTKHAMREMREPAVETNAPAPAHAQPAPEDATQPVATANADEPAVTPISPDPKTSEPAPAPDPEPVRTGRGGGWYPVPTDIGIDRPGAGGGVIIIRGGPGSANDPCDERDGHGRMPGMGGVIGGVLGGILGGHGGGRMGGGSGGRGRAPRF